VVPQIATGIETTGIAIDQLVHASENYATRPLGLHPQGVAGLEAGSAEGARRNRYLMLAGNPGLILYLFSDRSSVSAHGKR
jgi:hypothetical protein